MKRLWETLDEYGVDKIWDGYDIYSWIGDIDTRIAFLRDSAKLKQLEVLESRLLPLMTDEQNRKMVMTSMKNELQDLLGV